MVHKAPFWTFRAGTLVVTPLGHGIGRVLAVRRDAVLVRGTDGDTSWVDADRVLSYDGTVLVVSPVDNARAGGTSSGRVGESAGVEPEPQVDARVAFDA